VEVVQRAMAAYMRDDEATVRTLTASDVVISTRPNQPDVGDRRGYDGLLRTSAEWLETWDEHTFATARIWDAEDLVFVATREAGRGKLSGVPMESDIDIRVHGEPGQDRPLADLWL
jgi:ketosteroid isomerase-like protein